MPRPDARLTLLALAAAVRAEMADELAREAKAVEGRPSKAERERVAAMRARAAELRGLRVK